MTWVNIEPYNLNRRSMYFLFHIGLDCITISHLFYKYMYKYIHIGMCPYKAVFYCTKNIICEENFYWILYRIWKTWKRTKWIYSTVHAETKELRMHGFRVLIKSVVDSFCFQSYGDQSQKMTSTVWQGTWWGLVCFKHTNSTQNVA